MAAMARWFSDLEGGFQEIPCPDLYYCVKKACNVSSLENDGGPGRMATGQ